MRITLDSRKMEELMKAFYTVAGIRFVLFDTNHREIAAYPAESCAFCTAMKSCPRTRRRCVGADKRALKNAARAARWWCTIATRGWWRRLCRFLIMSRSLPI